jgi:hypothetical protein
MTNKYSLFSYLPVGMDIGILITSLLKLCRHYTKIYITYSIHSLSFPIMFMQQTRTLKLWIQQILNVMWKLYSWLIYPSYEFETCFCHDSLTRSWLFSYPLPWVFLWCIVHERHSKSSFSEGYKPEWSSRTSFPGINITNTSPSNQILDCYAFQNFFKKNVVQC